MGNLRTIKGLYIKHVSSDPSNLVEGDIWYNTTTQTLKTAPLIGAWASGGDLNTGRYGGGGGGATQSVGWCAGGRDGPGSDVALSEEYDGSSWTEGNNLTNARRYTAGFGPQTAAIIAGGYTTTNLGHTEEYDGTNWSEQNDLNSARRNHGTAGTSAAGLAVS